MNEQTNQISELEAIVLAPFFHNLDHILAVRIRSVLEHLNDFYQTLFAFLASHNCLEHANRCTSLTFPKLRVCVKSFEDIEGFN